MNNKKTICNKYNERFFILDIGTSVLLTRNEQAFTEFENFLHQNGFSNEKQLKIDNFHHAGYGVKSNTHIKVLLFFYF